METYNKTHRLATAAMFLAIAYVLPFITGNIPELGERFCLLHIPAFLCGYVCGGPWGALVGFIAPLLRSFTLGVPVLFPRGVAMAFELATYGFVSGLLYRVFPKRKGYIYTSLLASMTAGRIIRGLVQFMCMGLAGTEFSFSAFWTGTVVTALPGMVIQIALIPVLIIAFEKSKNN